MSSQDIRLRLTIRRHALPEVKLVWPCTASEDLTIAKLLSSVNDVVPLEGEQWGLEDYSVELNDGQGGDSFECLHFQQVRKVLKHDDQVLIRSLLTDDIKRRRLSGRHQISYDGKHLVDGIAFGRPWLRAPRDRPAVSLPPRKRARIEYHQDDDEENLELDHSPERLLLEDSSSARFPSNPVDHYHLDDDYDDDDDDDDDVDYNPSSTVIRHGTDADRDDNSVSAVSGDDESDLEEEIRLLREDNEIVGDDDAEPPPAALPAPHQTTAPDFTANFARAMRAPIAASKKAFPLTSERDIQAALLDHTQDLRSTYAALEAQEAAELTIDEIMDEILQHSLDPGVELDEEPALPSPKRPLIQEVEDISGPPSTKRKIEEITENDDTSSSESSGSGSDQPMVPQPTRRIIEEVTSESDAESDSESSDDSTSQNHNAMVSHSSGSSSGSSDDEDSSGSGSSDSDSDSDSSGDEAEEDGGVHGLSRSVHQQAAQSSDSSSDDSSNSDTSDDSDDSDDSSSGSSSDSDSESDSEPEKATAKAPVVNTKTRYAQPTMNAKPSNAPKATTPTASAQNGPESQVGRGQGLTKTQKRNQRRREAKQNMRAMNQQSGSTPTEATADKDADLVARKKALLEAVAADDDAATVPQKSSIPPSQSEQQPKKSSDSADNHDKQTEEGKATSPQDDTPRRRMRMDMGAGRRMLFGALGLKNPKTKADEEKLKKDLMKDVRPLKNHRQEEVEAAKVPDEEVSALARDNDKGEAEDAWRSKITYRAVECCHDGIVLSEPPFPFIQRWDPQQQYSSMRKRKRSSQNFHQDYYEDDSAMYGESQDPFDSGRHQKKNKTNKKKKKGGKGQEGSVEDVELNYDDPPASKRGVDSQMTDLDDLPSLPTDVSALPLLEATMVKPGMVITWKQLLLSKATNWQPELLTVTGLVVSFDSDKVLHLILAKRDREEQKTYDEETGQRIYDRFEVPSDSENDDDGEDDGHREIPWSDMIEPRIVQVEPTASTSNTPRKAAPLTEDGAEDGKGSGDKSQSQPASAEDTSHTMDVDADDNHQSGDSASIPSGQNGQVLDFSAPSIEAPTTSGESGQNISQTQSILLASSQASSQVNVFPPSSSLPEEADENSRQDQITGLNGTGMSPESGSVSSYQDAEPSLERDEGDGQRTPTASQGHVQMTEPSSANNERSGRQRDTENGAVGSPDDEEVIPDTNESARETTPKPSAPPSAVVSSRGSSPFFPSIEEIWHTATTSRQTQSPFKSSQVSVLRRGKGKNDEEYQAAMQRLDEGDESDSMPDLKNKSIRNLFPNATQPSPVANEPDVKNERRQPSSSFHVPDGSQVIMLDSSSPMAEDYADDDVDETYAERHGDSSSLPHGSGRVTKNKPSRNTRSSSSSSRAASKESLQASTSKDKAIKGVAPLLSANAVFGKRKSSGRKF